MILASQLWGYYKRQQGISAEAELEASRKHWLEEFSLTMPIAVDVQPPVPDRQDTTRRVPGPDRIGRALAIFTYPTFYLIDRAGVIRARFVGGFDEMGIEAKVEQLLVR